MKMTNKPWYFIALDVSAVMLCIQSLYTQQPLTWWTGVLHGFGLISAYNLFRIIRDYHSNHISNKEVNK